MNTFVANVASLSFSLLGRSSNDAERLYVVVGESQFIVEYQKSSRGTHTSDISCCNRERVLNVHKLFLISINSWVADNYPMVLKNH